MPVGLVVMKWDERIGTEVEAKYPEEINITDKTLMQVYSTHEYSGESGMISLMVGSLNIASYYTGPEKGFYVLLLLNLDDDPDSYEGGLADVSRIIIQDIDNEVIDETLANLFRRLSVYPTLNEEQQLFITYQDETKRMIINRLREEGVVMKSELIVWLKDVHSSGFVDMDSVLIDLIKRDIIKGSSVKGVSSELIFLINDLIMLRLPPIKLLTTSEERGLPLELSANYQKEVKNFFQEYRPSDADNLKLVELLNDPQVYEVIRLLRTAIVTKNDLEKLKKKGVDDINNILKVLWDVKMIQVFQDSQNVEYYALLCDFNLKLIFPTYQTIVIKSEYEQKSKSNKVLIEYLKVLEDAYINRTKSIKKRKIMKKKNK